MNLPNLVTHLTKVVKTNMMCTFCVRHHNGICFNVFATFVKTCVGKSLVTFRLPLLPLIEIFNHQTYGDQKHFVAIFLVCHFGHAIYMKKYLKAKKEIWKLQYFTMQKYNIQKHNPLKNTKLLQDIIILSLIPSFSTSQNIILQKSSHKNRPPTWGPKFVKLLYSKMNLNTMSLPW